MSILGNTLGLIVSALTKSSTITGTSGNDLLVGTIGKNNVYGLGGDDKVFGGFGSDWLYGGSGKDKIFGGFGKDWIYGDGPPEFVRSTVNFEAAATFSTLSANKKSLTSDGLKVEALFGELSQFHGASIQAPNDYPVSGAFTLEIDAYNGNNVDNPEGLRLSFEVAQSDVTITLGQMYNEWIYIVQPEKANVKVFFTDGTSTIVSVSAEADTQTGDVAVQLKSANFGGKLIASVELTPDLSVPSSIPASEAGTWNATHPFSEFTLKAVSFVTDANNAPGNDDKLYGGLGSDKLYGGKGNDRLSGGLGDDLLVGGSGNNSLIGGLGKDTFGFGFDATGKDVIKDFSYCVDKIKLYDGITVTGMTRVSGDTVLQLSTGGTITLVGVPKVNDWHQFL